MSNRSPSTESGTNSLLQDYGLFLRHYGKWYLVPVLLLLLLLGALIVAAGASAEPFVYAID